MRLLRALGAGLAAVAVSSGAAAASQADVNAALGTTITLLMIGILIWVIGSMFAGHKYDSGGPKGGPIAKQ